MQSTVNCGTITIVDGHIRCPICGKRLQRVPPDMMARHLPVYCSRCKVEFSVNIDVGQSLKASADAAVESIET